MINTEKVEQLRRLGLSDEDAEYYSVLDESNNVPWIAAHRFAVPINRRLSYYRKSYATELRERIRTGAALSPAESELIAAGVTAELMGRFALEAAQTAYSGVLTQLADPGTGEADASIAGGYPSWQLVELDKRGALTGRVLPSMSDLLGGKGSGDTKKTVKREPRKLSFVSYLRPDFVKSSVVIEYFPDTLEIITVFISHNSFGTMEVTGGVRDVHRWESEDEAQSGSYLNKHFTQIITDGVVDDVDFETQLLRAVADEISEGAQSADRDILLDVMGKLINRSAVQRLVRAPSA